MFDIWSGLADFLADMIEKYGNQLDLDSIPDIVSHRQPTWKKNMFERYMEKIKKLKLRVKTRIRN